MASVGFVYALPYSSMPCLTLSCGMIHALRHSMLPCHTPCYPHCRYLDEIGYSISAYGFSGPFVDPAFIKDGSVRLEAWNLYCVRKDLRQAQLALRAGVTAPKLKRP
jgi:hypothetical protein